MLKEIKLNRPKAKNALSTELLTSIQEQLIDALKDKNVEAVIINHEGEDFCAGGDVKSLYLALKDNNKQACRDFFTTEYSTDYLIHIYPKPIIVLAKGIHFGGGLGLSMGAKYRIIDPSSSFSMPEVLIGLFPDVGASYFLKDILWQERIDFVHKAQRISAGLAIDWNFADAIIEKQEDFYQELQSNFHKIDDLIKKYSVNGEIKKVDSPLSACPTSIEFSEKQLKIGESLSLRQAFIKEWSYAIRFMDNPNFKEGVRAILFDKDKNPKWNLKIKADPLFEAVDTSEFEKKLNSLEEIVSQYE